MIRAYTFALDPTPAQERALRSHCGAARFAYNHMLGVIVAVMDQREAERTYGVADPNLTPRMGWSAYSLRKEWNARKDEVAPWWADVSKEAFASGCSALASALDAWLKSRTGKRSGARVGWPRFKSRRSAMSCTFTTGTIRLEGDRRHVTLPRLGTIHLHENARRLARLIEQGRARITRATVSLHRGRWRVSLLAHVDQPDPLPSRGGVVGVDLGVKDLIVAATPDGHEVMRLPVPERLRALEQRKRALQRRSRNRQGPRRGVAPSNRWRRAQRQIDRIDWASASLREDVLHKATTALAKTFGTVVVEDLNVRGMATRGGAFKTGLNRGVHRAAMATTRAMLAYKTVREGGSVVVVDRFYPSSKTCSDCGSVRAKLALSERTYTCTTCGVAVDRDLNAAVNLARQGLAGSGPVTGRGAERKTTPPSGEVAAGDEASTSQDESPSDEDRLLATAGSASGAFALIC